MKQMSSVHRNELFLSYEEMKEQLPPLPSETVTRVYDSSKQKEPQKDEGKMEK